MLITTCTRRNTCVRARSPAFDVRFSDTVLLISTVTPRHATYVKSNPNSKKQATAHRNLTGTGMRVHSFHTCTSGIGPYMHIWHWPKHATLATNNNANSTLVQQAINYCACMHLSAHASWHASECMHMHANKSVHCDYMRVAVYVSGIPV